MRSIEKVTLGVNLHLPHNLRRFDTEGPIYVISFTFSMDLKPRGSEFEGRVVTFKSVPFLRSGDGLVGNIFGFGPW